MTVYLFVSTHTMRHLFLANLWQISGSCESSPEDVCMLGGWESGWFEGHLYLVYRCHSEMEQVLE